MTVADILSRLWMLIRFHINAGLRRVAEEFTAAGIGFCLDDFGSGYANLNTVMRLPFSVIKVDRSLLFDICRDEKRAIFYESVVETFHKMNYHIVSEGVETQEEMEQISSWGVEMIQGYYFSKPLPEKELRKIKLRGKGDSRYTWGHPIAEVIHQADKLMYENKRMS